MTAPDSSARLKQAFKLEQSMDSQRTLTDADVEAILAAMEKKFYVNVGKGIWGLAWKVILVGLAALAAYGAYLKK